MTKQMQTQQATVTTEVAPHPAPMQASNALIPANITEAMQMADMLANSDIVPKDFKGKSGNILVAIQWGLEVGLPPLQALQNIAVINGRPSMWGDAVLALVRGSGKLEYIKEADDGHTATCIVKRKGEPTEHISTFSMDDAKQAGLLNKAGPWSQYPKRMRQMRARSFALRDVFPDVLKGIAIAEEVMDTETIDTTATATTETVTIPTAPPKKEEPRHKIVGNRIMEKVGGDVAAFKAFVIEKLEWPADTPLEGKWMEKLTDEELDILESAVGLVA